jgi:hypothetical protein
MLNSMPAIDANVIGDWTENQVTLYQSMPYYLAKVQADMKTTFPTFSKLTKKRKWQQNKGPILRGVRTNPSPHMRQFFNPQLVTQNPNTDVMNVRESTMEAQVRWHDFESPIFNWYPSFNDFMDHIDDNGKDIMEKIERANEVFLRGFMFHMAPFALIVQNDGTVKKVEAAPYWNGSGSFDGGVAQGKTAAWLGDAANLPTGPLSMTAIEMAMTIAETDWRIPFFQGSELPKDDQPLDGKFLWIMDSEPWNRLVFDPFVQGNRTLDFNIVTNGYRGSFFGRATTRLEDMPLRYGVAGASASFAAPEIRIADGEEGAGETVPNTVYTDPAQSQYAVAWLCGKMAYESIDVGPPPSQFTSDSFPNAPKMDWNAQVRLTKNFLLKQIDSIGAVTWQANTYGKYLKFISEATFGILGINRRNVIPVLYQRRRGA